MQLVVDTSVLVGDLLRESGRQRLRDPRLTLAIAAATLGEANYEIPRRIQALESQGRLSALASELLWRDISSLIESRVTTIPEGAYEPIEEEARWRSARDPNDWPVVAAALVTDSAIWTDDNDFLGTGVATWTTQTLTSWLAVQQ